MKLQQERAEQAEVEEAVRESNPDEFSHAEADVSRHSMLGEPNLNVSSSELMPRPKKVKKKKKKVPQPAAAAQAADPADGKLPPIN